MTITVRIAKTSDKKKFVELALERDKGAWTASSNLYKPFQKTIGNPKYWENKFNELVKSKRMLIATIGKIPVGFLHFSLEFIDYPTAYIELIFVSKKT